jgi:hypothetical protein
MGLIRVIRSLYCCKDNATKITKAHSVLHLKASEYTNATEIAKGSSGPKGSEAAETDKGKTKRLTKRAAGQL